MEALAPNKTIRRFGSHREQQVETYGYWQNLSIGERFEAVWDATATAYALKGVKYDATRRSEATLTRVQRKRS